MAHQESFVGHGDVPSASQSFSFDFKGKADGALDAESICVGQDELEFFITKSFSCRPERHLPSSSEHGRKKTATEAKSYKAPSV